jgi:hypothetical protein
MRGAGAFRRAGIARERRCVETNALAVMMRSDQTNQIRFIRVFREFRGQRTRDVRAAGLRGMSFSHGI